MHEIMTYQYACDGCGEVETLEVEELPVDWTEDDGEHFCEDCS